MELPDTIPPQFILEEANVQWREMKNAVVTGGYGFIGSALVDKLADFCDSVTIVDREKRKKPWLNITRDNISFVKSSASKKKKRESAFRKALAGADTVFHLMGPPQSVEQDLFFSSSTDWLGTPINEIPTALYYKRICDSTGLLCKVAKEMAIERIVYSSSIRVYGNVDQSGPIEEGQGYSGPTPSAFVREKKKSELILLNDYLSLNPVILRYGYVFGPGSKHGLIPSLLRSAITGKEVALKVSKTSNSDFVYIDNVVYQTILAALSKTAPGNAINVGRGQKRSIQAAMVEIGAIIKRQPNYNYSVKQNRGHYIQYKDFQEPKTRTAWLSTEKATDLLGWWRLCLFREEIEQLNEWALEYDKYFLK